MGKLQDRPKRRAGGTPAGGKTRQTIGEFARALLAKMPEEERNKLPADLSENHDHYLYGSPKVRK